MSSSSSDSRSESTRRSLEVDGDSTRLEDNKILLAVKSRDAKKLLNAVICLTSDDSNSVCVNDTLRPETFRLSEFYNILLEHLVETDIPVPNISSLLRSIRCKERLVGTELHCHGPGFIRGIILFITCVERPEKISLIKNMLDLRCDINFTDRKYRNILHRLVHKDFSYKPYQQVAELLIREGIDLTALNLDAYTPLEYAILHTNLDMVRLLLRYGIQKSIIADYENVAHFAFQKKRIRSLHTIIKFYLLRELQGKVSDENIIDFVRRGDISEHYKRCLKDLEFLKKNIVNTEVSLHDIFSKPEKIVVNYMRNNDIISEIKRIIKENSDLSHDIAEIRDKALIRRDLEDVVTETLEKVFKFPECGSKMIISYLDDDSLRNISMID